MEKVFFIILFSFWSLIGSCQVTQVQFITYPAGSIIHVDGVKVGQGPVSASLSHGEHRVQAWSPKFEILDTTIVVQGDSLTKVILKLTHSAEYYKYMQDMAAWRRQSNIPVNWGLAAGLTTLSGGGVAQMALVAEKGRIKVKMDEYRTGYDEAKSQESIDSYRKLFEEQQAKFHDLRKVQYLTGGLTAIAAGFFSFKMFQAIHRNRSLTRPVRQPENGLSFTPVFEINKARTAAGLQFCYTF